MAVTARAVIQGALKLLTVLDPLETVEPQDAEDGLEVLNDMIDQWALAELNLFASTNITGSFAGVSATVGPSGVINATRPQQINHAFYTSGGQDLELDVMRNRASYDRINEKLLAGVPERVFYEPTSPLGTLYVWPVPPGVTSYTLNVDLLFTQFADLDTQYQLPPGYRTALKTLLCEPLAPVYSKPINPDLKHMITMSRRMLKRSNVVVPELTLEWPGRRDLRAERAGEFPF